MVSWDSCDLCLCRLWPEWARDSGKGFRRFDRRIEGFGLSGSPTVAITPARYWDGSDRCLNPEIGTNLVTFVFEDTDRRVFGSPAWVSDDSTGELKGSDFLEIRRSLYIQFSIGTGLTVVWDLKLGRSGGTLAILNAKIGLYHTKTEFQTGG